MLWQLCLLRSAAVVVQAAHGPIAAALAKAAAWEGSYMRQATLPAALFAWLQEHASFSAALGRNLAPTSAGKARPAA